MTNADSPRAPDASDVSRELGEGWHCAHFFYRFDRAALTRLSAADLQTGREQLIAALDSSGPAATVRMQAFVVSGHKADFGTLLMDPDPLKIDAAHQCLMASRLGPALIPTYSFVSITEVSEYVPTVEQYAERLVREGEERNSPAFQAKVKAYGHREPMMRKARLTPELPAWPALCFYPMNKKREVGENWFLLPFARRNELMAEHARSGLEFAGKVSQLITAGVGLEDWEWGVTLWARTPQFLKDIVYRMRYDEASARYAQFGPVLHRLPALRPRDPRPLPHRVRANQQHLDGSPFSPPLGSAGRPLVPGRDGAKSVRGRRVVGGGSRRSICRARGIRGAALPSHAIMWQRCRTEHAGYCCSAAWDWRFRSSVPPLRPWVSSRPPLTWEACYSRCPLHSWGWHSRSRAGFSGGATAGRFGPEPWNPEAGEALRSGIG